MRWGALGLVLLVGCGTSHTTDGPVDEAGARMDGPSSRFDGGDGGEVEIPPPPLVALTADDGVGTLHGLTLDGASRRLGTVGLAERSWRRRIVGGPRGRHGLVAGYRWHLVDWVTGDSLDVLESVAAVDGGLCADPEATAEVWWRSDGEAVFVQCSLWERSPGVRTAVDQAVFQVRLDGTASPIASGWRNVVVTTHDARLVVAIREAPEEWSYHLVDPREGSMRSVPVGEDVALHFWDRDRPGFIASTVSIVDFRYVYRDLRWLDEDASESMLLEPMLPEKTYLLPLSPDGALLVARRDVDSGMITSVSIRERSGRWIDTEVPECLPPSGVPTRVHWAPDGSAFTLACRDRSWIVSREGRALRLDPEASDEVEIDLRWSPSSDHVLRVFRTTDDLYDRHWELVDAETGAARDITAPSVAEREVRSVQWTQRPWRPDCGRATACR